MASRSLPEEGDFNRADARPRRARPVRRLRTAKPEEGDDRGELLHFLRALLLVVVATTVFGWLVS